MNGLLKMCSIPVTHFYPEAFTTNLFFQEVETRPFLSSAKGVVVHEIDQMNDSGKEALVRYLEKPSPWISLYLTALELAPQSKLAKLMEKKGEVHRFKEEKPWEKEKRLSSWLISEAKREGCLLSMEGAMALVKGIDHQMLSQELNKLICCAGERREIDLQDINILCTPVHHETLWQLGDALLGREVSHALKVANSLLEEGMVIFPLLASLRTQFLTGIEILHAADLGEVAQHFPYLKGKLLDNKLKILKKQGVERLQQGVLLMFETEVKAKNSSANPSLLLELLIVKLSYDTLPVT